MNIVLGENNVRDLHSKYVVLELDTFLIEGKDSPVTAYCVLGDLAPEDMIDTQQYIDLHANLIKNYRVRNWNYCEQAISHLKGRWQGQIDSFYLDLSQRVDGFRASEPAGDWTGFIPKSA